MMNDPAEIAEIGEIAEIDPMHLHPSIAAAWDVWSVVIAQTALRRLEQVRETFPELSAAVLSSADGMHVCSLGVDVDDAERLAAMNSSLFGVARAESQIMVEDTDPAARTIVTITIGNVQTAVLGLVVEPFGQLLLGISAQDVQLGTLMLTARSAASEIATLLGETTAPEL